MVVKLLDAAGVERTLLRLVREHEEIYVAAAWGANGRIAENLFQHTGKFCFVTFGVAFCQTDPDLIDRLVGVDNAFISSVDTGTFHPKLYYFATGDEAEVIIGSSNFTSGGLGVNVEANVHIKGPRKSRVFRDIEAALEGYKKFSSPVSAKVAAMYRLQFEAAKRLKHPANPKLPGDGKRAEQFSSPIATMTWGEFSRFVKDDSQHSFEGRLSLLRDVRAMFARSSSFSDLSDHEWKAISGIIGEKQKEESNLNQHDWAWFGSMKGAGSFANRIKERDQYIVSALDNIPRHGNVEEHHFKEFCEEFSLAFSNAKRKGQIATATRLLAMKRPDAFICISNPNAIGVAEALAVGRHTIKLHNYWEKVIEPIRVSPWYNHPKPAGTEGELWEGRVAMLDAIYYKPE